MENINSISTRYSNGFLIVKNIVTVIECCALVNESYDYDSSYAFK